METAFAKPRLASLLDHFSVIEDPRVAWRVAHPLPEVLLLVVSATVASCDDFDDIAAWGEAHLDFLRRFMPYYFEVPCAALAQHFDEPYRPGTLLGLLHGLGPARCARMSPAAHRA